MLRNIFNLARAKSEPVNEAGFDQDQWLRIRGFYIELLKKKSLSLDAVLSSASADINGFCPRGCQ